MIMLDIHYAFYSPGLLLNSNFSTTHSFDNYVQIIYPCLSDFKRLDLFVSPFSGFVYDVTGDYRTSFYVAGGCMLVNSMIIVMDPVWKDLDLRRLGSKRNTADQIYSSV